MYRKRSCWIFTSMPKSDILWKTIHFPKEFPISKPGCIRSRYIRNPTLLEFLRLFLHQHPSHPTPLVFLIIPFLFVQQKRPPPCDNAVGGRRKEGVALQIDFGILGPWLFKSWPPKVSKVRTLGCWGGWGGRCPLCRGPYLHNTHVFCGHKKSGQFIS